MGKGKTLVSAGVVLPSRVTNLIIKRPAGFNFSPGDWVFIKIPEVARFEWHPFTISSAPEVHDTFTVHIRGVGEWTNRVYKYFEDEYARQQDGVNTRENKVDKFRGTVRAKYDNARTIMSKSIRIKPTEDADFVSLAEKYTVDKEKQSERIKKREDKLAQLSNSLNRDGSFKETEEETNNNNNEESNSPEDKPSELVSPPTINNADIPRPQGFNKRFLKSLRYLRQEPTIIKYDTGSNSSIDVPAGLTYDDGIERFELMVNDSGELRNRKVSHYDGPGKRAKLNKPLEVSAQWIKIIKIFKHKFNVPDLHRRAIWESLEQLLQGRARRSYRHRDRYNALCLHLAINHAQASIIVPLNYSLYIFTRFKQTRGARLMECTQRYRVP